MRSPWPWVAAVLFFGAGVAAPLDFPDDPVVLMGWWMTAIYGLTGLVYLLLGLYFEGRAQGELPE